MSSSLGHYLSNEQIENRWQNWCCENPMVDRRLFYFFVSGDYFLWQNYALHQHNQIKCAGNGIVVPYSSHKREFDGSIPGWAHQKTIFSLSPLPLLPQRLRSYFDVWRHLSPAKIRKQHRSIETTARPAHVEVDGVTTTVYWRGADRGDQVVTK
jgi:hypothetical protein